MKKTILTALTCCMVSAAFANDEQSYVGSYTKGSVDTLQQLIVLPDHTFCYALTAGSLDLLVGGRWRVEDGVIFMNEVRRPNPVLPVVASFNGEVKKRTVQAAGQSLSDNLSVIYGTSRDGKMPADMRPILAEDYNGFDSRYDLPIMDNDVSIFVGVIKNDAESLSRNTVYEIFQYDLNVANNNMYTIYFNREAVRPMLNVKAFFNDKNLQLSSQDTEHGMDGAQDFGKKTVLLKNQNSVKEQCINPAFSTEVRVMSGERVLLKPVKQFEAQLDMDKKAPYYETPDEYKNQR